MNFVNVIKTFKILQTFNLYFLLYFNILDQLLNIKKNYCAEISSLLICKINF